MTIRIVSVIIGMIVIGLIIPALPFFPTRVSAQCDYPKEVCGSTCCFPGECEYCGCGKPLNWCCGGCGCGCGCTPNCTGKCGSESDGCGGNCSAYACATAGNATPDCDWVGGSCTTNYGGYVTASNATGKRVALLNVVNATNVTFPTWTNYGGQDDLNPWEGVAFYWGGHAYSEIYFNRHNFHISDQTVYTHYYLYPPSTGAYKTAMSWYKCWGHANTSTAGAVTVNYTAFYTSLTVSGNPFVANAGSNVRVGTCN